MRRRLPLSALLIAWALAACSIQPVAGVQTEPAETRTALPAILASPVSPAGIAPAPSFASGSPTELDCVLRATFLQDLATADHTQLPPSEPFAKSWRLRNDGSCVWDESYTLTFIGGDRMDAADTTPLGRTVLPGGSIDLAVDMIAPVQPGSYQGFWKLQDAQGHLFGVGSGGHLSLWVKIEVLQELLNEATTTASAQSEEGELPEQVISGRAALPPGFAFDLDSGEAQAESGADILWSGELIPQGAAAISRPFPAADAGSRAVCDAEALGSAPIAADDLSARSAVCYRTDQGQPGRLTILEVDEALRFDYTTWEATGE